MMKNIKQTLFGQLYFLNKQSHFQLKTSNLYCETFFIQNHYIYGIFEFKQLSKNELYSNLIIGTKDNLFKIEEQYRISNNIETIKLQNFDLNIKLQDINNDTLKIILNKTNNHIINCSCCHRH
jgi:hypothetical protein